MNYWCPSDATNHRLLYGIDDAISNQSLYIGLTFAYYNATNNGLFVIHMNQLVAETCSMIEEALLVFERVSLAVQKNFSIADSKGTMAVVEHTSKRYAVMHPVNGIIVQTNHYLDPDFSLEDSILNTIQKQPRSNDMRRPSRRSRCTRPLYTRLA